MKYIMFELELEQEFANVKSMKQKIPIIFPDQLVHKEIANAMAQALKRHYGNLPVKVVSAGDCTIDCLATAGKSDTLLVEAKAEDAKVIDNYEYLHGL